MSIKPEFATKEPFLSLAQTRMVALVFMVELNIVPDGRSSRICLVEAAIVKVDVVAAETSGVRQMIMRSMVRVV